VSNIQGALAWNYFSAACPEFFIPIAITSLIPVGPNLQYVKNTQIPQNSI